MCPVFLEVIGIIDLYSNSKKHLASNGGSRSAVSSWGSMSRSNLAVMGVLLVSAMNLQGAEQIHGSLSIGHVWGVTPMPTWVQGNCGSKLRGYELSLN